MYNCKQRVIGSRDHHTTAACLTKTQDDQQCRLCETCSIHNIAGGSVLYMVILCIILCTNAPIIHRHIHIYVSTSYILQVPQLTKEYNAYIYNIVIYHWKFEHAHNLHKYSIAMARNICTHYVHLEPMNVVEQQNSNIIAIPTSAEYSIQSMLLLFSGNASAGSNLHIEVTLSYC